MDTAYTLQPDQLVYCNDRVLTCFPVDLVRPSLDQGRLDGSQSAILNSTSMVAGNQSVSELVPGEDPR